jgi:hypothetical protein
MIKHTLAAVSLVVLAASPALAQSTAPMNAERNQSTKPMNAQIDSNRVNLSATTTNLTFLNEQSASEWRSSNLVGAKVVGANKQNIGEINEVLIDNSGVVKAVIIGVGGFLGVGEKDVAVPFSALQVSRKLGSEDIDQVTVNYSKDQLSQAPSFKYLSARDATNARQSTGESPATNNNMPRR